MDQLLQKLGLALIDTGESLIYGSRRINAFRVSFRITHHGSHFDLFRQLIKEQRACRAHNV